MDLLADVYDPEVPGVLTLLHPKTGEPLLGDDGSPVVFEIWGPDSVTFKSAMRRLTNRVFNEKTDKKDVDVDEEEITALAAVTKGWSSNFSLKGEKLEVSPSNAKKLLKRVSWIQQQIREFAQERVNFIQASAKKS